MRAGLIALTALAAALAATATATGTTARTAAPSASCVKASLTLVKPGTLTIGTDNPAYPPWYGGGTTKGSKWQLNDPSNGKGFEPAVAYAVASKLGFTKSEVNWVYVPFNNSFAPGKKKFDFDINQISYTAARAKVVTFSSSYYDVDQALVVLKGTPISHVRSLAGLRGFKLAAELGTTSYYDILGAIKPTKQPSVFDTDAAAVQALKNKQIDGLVVDLPTAFYISGAEVPNSTVSGQFPPPRGGEHFGMVFQKGNPLASCVDGALKTLKANGTLAKIKSTWLSKATGAPVLK
ncbi:MAG TPA: ABC transporter substrate-binding protein [Gaiellaceae bacterium]|nr:ABC transporter substrate-binding protein [Gaiellaceae bacterium]